MMKIHEHDTSPSTPIQRVKGQSDKVIKCKIRFIIILHIVHFLVLSHLQKYEFTKGVGCP